MATTEFGIGRLVFPGPDYFVSPTTKSSIYAEVDKIDVVYWNQDMVQPSMEKI